MARVHLIEPHQDIPVPYYPVAKGEVAAEQARYRTARQIALQQLDELIGQVTARMGAAPANIFVAQKMMLEDPVLIAEIEAVILDERINAEMAVLRVSGRYERELGSVDSDFLRERVADIVEIRRRVLNAIRGLSGLGPPSQRAIDFDADDHRILVAVDLTPSETVSLDTSRVAGFITERGGTASHAAILARALGIPAISGIPEVLRNIPNGCEALIDGKSGAVFLDPGPDTLRVYPAARRRTPARVQAVAPVPGFRVLANISRAVDLPEVNAVQAEGIGLYRTEFEFLAAGRMLTEDEQYALYAEVVRAMQGRPLHARLLDFGADKSADFLDIGPEDNPCLGFRGARLLLERQDLFLDQARALARASLHGPVHVTYPMIADVDQFLVLRERFTQHTADIAGARIVHGVMFEVPSACLAAREILEVAQFGSIGSNDLIQYLFAVDRNNEHVAHDYNPDHPVLWRVLGDLAAAAAERERPLSLCGEMGGQPKHLPRLMDLGIETVSVSPRLVGLARMGAKRALRRARRAG